MIPGERLYLYDDAELGIVGQRNRVVRDRHTGRYRKALEMMSVRGGNWLDCACGSGYGAEIVAQSGRARWVWGVDRDPTALLYARRHHDHHEKITYVGSDVEHAFSACVSAGSASHWQAVVSIETMEHLDWQRQHDWVEQCSLHLDMEGELFVSCPIGAGAPSQHNPWHLYEPTAEQLLDLLESHFSEVYTDEDVYTSTAGVPAMQAFAVCRKPRR